MFVMMDRMGGDDVCTVEASSQSHFYDGIVYLLFFEILESQGCG